ncbi:Argonaute complex, subunit Arb1 [Podospora conica]|nr:Argonaute complex, subunit Arb1 [Schizothecium conicum]
MSAPTESVPTTASEAKKENKPQKVDIGNLRLQDDDDVEEKKKKKRRPKKRATGFEEFYCDPPITPAQYQEERENTYPPDRPFVDRIEECIQRFRGLRRMDNVQDKIFSAYLLLGGVDSRPRQFQGTSKLKASDLEGMTKAEVRGITADDMIPRGEGATDIRFYNPSAPEHWDISFTAVASGFLSVHLLGLYPMDTIEFQKGVAVVLNFLKYVVTHDVCPEYADDLRRAQKVCVAAKEETQAAYDLQQLLPGTFNLAGTMLLEAGMKPTFESESAASRAPFDKEAARTILLTHGSVLLDNDRSERLQKALNDPDARIVKGKGCFEVVSISPPRKEWVAQLEVATKCMNEHFKQDLSLDACGILRVRPNAVRDGWEENQDMLPDMFYVENEALECFKRGMRIQLNFITLESCGLISFVSKVETVYQSFYTFLPQELMTKYKEPKFNPRPAKSIYDDKESGEDGEDMVDDD